MAQTQDRIGLNDHQAFEPTSPLARQQDPKQSINARSTGAGWATLQHGDLMAQRDRFKQQRGGVGPGFFSGDRDPCGSAIDAGELQTLRTTNEIVRIKFEAQSGRRFELKAPAKRQAGSPPVCPSSRRHQF